MARERLRDLGYSSRDMKGAVDTRASISILQVLHRRGGAFFHSSSSGLSAGASHRGCGSISNSNQLLPPRAIAEELHGQIVG